MVKMKKYTVFILIILMTIAGCSSNIDSEDKNQQSDKYEEVVNSTEDDNLHTGLNIFIESSRRFPAWLSVGKELFMLDSDELPNNIDRDIDVAEWYENVVSKGLPSLCDEWFIPGFIEDNLSEHAHSIAYAFVKHLNDIGHLDELALMYLYDETLWDAERTRASLWADFAGGVSTVSKTVFQYYFEEVFDDIHLAGGNHVDDLDPVPIKLTALTQQAQYYFSTSSWTRESIEHYIEVSEEAITFAGDFLNYHHDEPLKIIVYAPPHSLIEIDGWATFPATGGRYLCDVGATIIMWCVPEQGPSAITHEAAHAILDLSSMRHNNNFPIMEWMSDCGSGYFEEGLCVVIENLFITETLNEQYALTFSQLYFGLNKRVTWDDVVNRVNSNAKWELDNDNLISIITMENLGYENPAQAAKDLPYWELQSYDTAASFILYLTEEKGTWDDFFQVFADINLMEEIYGVGMEGIIAEWREFIRVRPTS